MIDHPEPAMPLTHAGWAANSEAYARLIAGHLHPGVRWLDAGCGGRLLEADLDPLEDWLVAQCPLSMGMDVFLKSHRNIRQLVRGSLDALPFASESLDLVTCNMVVEHLEDPARAFGEVARCLKAGGAFVIQTPNLWNYGLMANAVATRVLPEAWRLRLVRTADSREPEDIFPVRYRANTLRRLVRLLNGSGLDVHSASTLPLRTPFLARTAWLEGFLMELTPNVRLLVSARKPDGAR